MKTWWQRLKDRLIAEGMSQADLARSSGVSHANVRKYLSGAVQHPKGDALGKLAAALGVSEQWVLFGDDTLGQNAYPYPEIAWKELLPMSVAQTDDDLDRLQSTRSGQTFMARAIDASMSPSVTEGAELRCRWQSTANPNDVVIVLVDGSEHPIIRRYREVMVNGDGTVTVAFSADNPAFPEYRATRGSGYRILARVTHVVRAL